jgi:hypothetical protein
MTRFLVIVLSTPLAGVRFGSLIFTIVTTYVMFQTDEDA